MKVKDIMTHNAETINFDATLVQAARKMRMLDVGALPVRKVDSIIGIVTDRDIAVRAAAEKKNPSFALVKDIMTPDIYYCFEDDSIHDAATMMAEKRVHRLIVFNLDFEPVGFLSLADFAVKGRDEHLTFEIYERISSPACPQR